MSEVTSKIKGVYMQDGAWVIDKIVRGKRLRRNTGITDYAQALDQLARLMAGILKDGEAADWCAHVDAMKDNRSTWLHRAYRSMATRGKTTRKGCTVSFSEFELLVKGTGGRCELTGIPFSDAKPQGARSAPWQMSVDRIESSMGYDFDNIRIVCLAVNLAMREWGVGVLHRIGRAALLRELQRDEVPAESPPEKQAGIVGLRSV